MNNSYLPIDVCEHIIDEVGRQESWIILRVGLGARVPVKGLHLSTRHLMTWCSTSLVCSSWRPRSQLNLLSNVRLETESQLDLLLRTLTENPALSSFIVNIEVHDNTSYIPFHRLALLGLRSEGIALRLGQIAWKYYPPRYLDTALARLHGHITSLECAVDLIDISLATFFRFIWALPRLRHLHLHTITLGSEVPHGYPESCIRGRLESDSTCAALQKLQLDVSICILAQPPR